MADKLRGSGGTKSRYGRRDIPVSEGLAQKLWEFRTAACTSAARYGSDREVTPSNVVMRAKRADFRRRRAGATGLEPTQRRKNQARLKSGRCLHAFLFQGTKNHSA